MPKLVDAHNRKIDYLRISIIDRCNLRCIYCMPAEGIRQIEYHDILRYEEIIRIVKVASQKGITKIRITGGEPLIRRGLEFLIKSIADIKGIEDISLTTNGVLLKKMAESLYQAGLRRVNISLDSLNPKKYEEITRGGQLSHIWEGIEEVQRLGMKPIKFNVVAIKGFNDDEILDFAKLTLENPFHIRFIEFMPIGAKEIWSKDKCIPIEEIMKRISKFGKLTPATSPKKSGPAKKYKLDHALGQIGFISPMSNHFCNTCNRLRLTADGRLRPCLFSDAEVDLKSPLRNGCSDDELEKLFDYAISIKPTNHKLDEYIKIEKRKRIMPAIGG